MDDKILNKVLKKIGIGRKILPKDPGIERVRELTKKTPVQDPIEKIEEAILRNLLNNGCFPDCESIMDIPTYVRRDLKNVLKSLL
ncbi:hypothetical protein K0B04_01315 [Patescibacteria group bacterium]|nr:hypothetical protein [Patescibacteria group bacterium]